MAKSKWCFIISIVFLGCTNSEPEPLDVIIDQPKEDSGIRYEEYNVTAGDPDTALAIALFHRSDKPDFRSEFAEYWRLEMEYDTIIRLIKSIYKNNRHLEKALKDLDRNRLDFILYARKIVLDDLQQYGKVEGREWDFLVERNDSLVNAMLGPLVPADK